MELGSNGEGGTGVPHDLHASNPYFTSSTSTQQMEQGQYDATGGQDYISSLASPREIEASDYNHCHAVERVVRNGENSKALDVAAAICVSKKKSRPKTTKQGNKPNAKKRKDPTPLQPPGSTFIPQQYMHQQQQQQQQQSYHQNYSRMTYSNSTVQPGFPMNHTPLQQEQYMHHGHFPGAESFTRTPGNYLPPLNVNENFNGMASQFQFQQLRHINIATTPSSGVPRPALYNQQQVTNGTMRDKFNQLLPVQYNLHPNHSNTYGGIPPNQQFEQLQAQHQDSLLLNERITAPFPKAEPIDKKASMSVFSPVLFPQSSTSTGSSSHIDLNTSLTPCKAMEHKNNEPRSQPTIIAPCDAFEEQKDNEPAPQSRTTARPEKRLPIPPTTVSTREKNDKKSVRFKNKAVIKKKQRAKKTKKKSRVESIIVRRGGESDEETVAKTKRQRLQQNEGALDQAISLHDPEESNHIASYDDAEYRYVNPLLELPPFPGLRISNKPYGYYHQMLQSLNSGVPSTVDPANASEIWNISQIYFPRPDTFPLRYLARLLGFELSSQHDQEERHRQESQDEESDSLAIISDRSVIQEESGAHESCPMKLINENSETTHKPAEVVSGLISTVVKASSGNEEGNFNVCREVDHILTKQLTVTRISSVENDPIMNLPTLGSCYQPKAENVVDDDVEDLDPVWTNIKQCYQGYSKKYFFPLTAIQSRAFFRRKVSDECLKFAQELKIAPLHEKSSLSFRFATMEDEGILRSLVCKEKSNYQGFRQLRDCDEVSAAIKCPGEFFILVFRNNDQEKTLLGFIHYCFHWYRLQGEGAQSFNTPGQLSEAMMYINEVCCSTELFDGTCETGTRIIEVLLECHAFEHARSCGICYGMMHVSKSISTRYIHLFRMTELPTDNDNSNDSWSLLAIGLSKSNHRYTLRMLKDMSAKRADLDFPGSINEHQKLGTSHRMLIKMPSKEVAANFFSSQTAVSLGSLTRSDRKTASQAAPVSSVKHSLRDKYVVVRLNEAKKTISYGDLDEPLNDTITNINIPLSVLRCFPLIDANDSYGQPVNANCRMTDEYSGDLMFELSAKQQQLKELETELEPRLKNLLRCIVRERVLYDSKASQEKRAVRQECLKNYEKVMERKKAAALAWQMQQEQDMDAVCDICNDGEVSVNNQILFCESCNVAVHQICYGIELVPVGDWFCRVCRYFNRHEVRRPRVESEGLMSKTLSEPLPICCELCPRKQGAFVRTENSQNLAVTKWVHVVCAKWQGLNYLDTENPECVESVLEMKFHFRSLGISCFLCKGMRGAYHKCNTENCDRYMHMSCARSLGSCSVIHGETADGLLDIADAWKLKCPEHSRIEDDDIPEGSLTADELVEASKHFPSDPLPPPPKPSPKTYSRLPMKEREELLKDAEFETELIKEVIKKKDGAICEICCLWEGIGKSQEGDVLVETGIFWCNGCGLAVHKECYIADQKLQETVTRANFLCAACTYLKTPPKENEVHETPYCNMCNQQAGPLHKAFAIPISLTKWKKDLKAYNKSMFGRQIWCHSLCAMWNPQISISDDRGYNCTMVIMSNGTTHIHEKWVCALCCKQDKVKVSCGFENCNYRGTKKPYRFHITCARQAGFQIADEAKDGLINLIMLCFDHMKGEFSIRAQLEDFMEVEKIRAGKNLTKGKSMALSHFARLLQMATKILAVFGWAWRWAEWWVEKGDRWEPFSEEVDLEDAMSSSEDIESTPESRCADARRCRLAALGAALRNRDYDKEKGDDRVALDRALRAVLHTPSLAGPLKDIEIDFFAEWLGRAYRSKDRLLGFGADKIPVASHGECFHMDDLSPKFKLGNRPLPGNQVLKKGEIFESYVVEVDDFLKPMDPNADERGKKAKSAIKTEKEKKVKASPIHPLRSSRRSHDPVPCQHSSHEVEAKNNSFMYNNSLEVIEKRATEKATKVGKLQKVTVRVQKEKWQAMNEEASRKENRLSQLVISEFFLEDSAGVDHSKSAAFAQGIVENGGVEFPKKGRPMKKTTTEKKEIKSDPLAPRRYRSQKLDRFSNHSNLSDISFTSQTALGQSEANEKITLPPQHASHEMETRNNNCIDNYSLKVIEKRVTEKETNDNRKVDSPAISGTAVTLKLEEINADQTQEGKDQVLEEKWQDIDEEDSKGANYQSQIDMGGNNCLDESNSVAFAQDIAGKSGERPMKKSLKRGRPKKKITSKEKVRSQPVASRRSRSGTSNPDYVDRSDSSCADEAALAQSEATENLTLDNSSLQLHSQCTAEKGTTKSGRKDSDEVYRKKSPLKKNRKASNAFIHKSVKQAKITTCFPMVKPPSDQSDSREESATDDSSFESKASRGSKKKGIQPKRNNEEKCGSKMSPSRKVNLSNTKKQHKAKQNDDDDEDDWEIQLETIPAKKRKASESIIKGAKKAKKTKAKSVVTEDLGSYDAPSLHATFKSQTFTKNNDVGKNRSKKILGFNRNVETPVTSEMECLLPSKVAPSKKVRKKETQNDRAQKPASTRSQSRTSPAYECDASQHISIGEPKTVVGMVDNNKNSTADSEDNLDSLSPISKLKRTLEATNGVVPRKKVNSRLTSM